MFAANSEFDKLKQNYTFGRIKAVKLRISTQIGYTTKVLIAPPVYFNVYLSNQTPFNTTSIAALDQAVKHDMHRPTTEVMYKLPKYLDYYSGMIIGSDAWFNLRGLSSYQYFYIGLGYFNDPSLDVVAATAIPLYNVEISLLMDFAGPILAA
jgi:hypothetical protein